jgi:hypothetical protein
MDSTDKALLARQDGRQAAAVAVLADLGLMGLLRRVGRPVQTGSYALGLMVARDIDVTTLCPALHVAAVFDLGRTLATHPRVWRVTFRNDTGAWRTEGEYPDGLYWMVEYVADGGDAWKLDLWFIREGTTQFDLEHIRTLPARLDDERRAAILRIKEARRDSPGSESMPSYRVYEAVLDHGIRTPDEFEAYLAAR